MLHLLNETWHFTAKSQKFVLIAFTFNMQQELFHCVGCEEAADWLHWEKDSKNIERCRYFDHSIVELEELIVREFFESLKLLPVFGKYLCQLVK